MVVTYIKNKGCKLYYTVETINLIPEEREPTHSKKPINNSANSKSTVSSEEFIENLKELQRLEEEIAYFRNLCDNEEFTGNRYDRHSLSRQPGIGLRIGGGKEPRLYRTLDPSRPLWPPKKKISGLDFRVYPGRGFSISPTYD